MDGGMLLVFSEVHLDHAETLVKLEVRRATLTPADAAPAGHLSGPPRVGRQVVLRGYEIAGKQLMGDGASAKPFADTFTFVFCGNFSSTPYSPEVPRSKVKLLFRRFAEVRRRPARRPRAVDSGVAGGASSQRLLLASGCHHSPLSPAPPCPLL